MTKKDWVLFKELQAYVGILLGSLIAALGLVLFLVPHRIAAGGVSGLAVIIHHLFGFPVGLTMLALNIPLFLAGLKVLGLNFGLKTLFGTLTLSALTDVLAWIKPPTADALLAAIYGGITTGVGLGLVFRFGGSTGGTDLAALLFRRLLHISPGIGLLIVDATVITLAGLTFNFELALYALLALFLTSRAIDVVQEGSGYAKAALIISDKPEEITSRIFSELNRGATGLQGRGLYTGRQREVLLCVVNRSEVSRLKQVVAEVDKNAFVIVANIHEVLGEGFREWR
ncbi:MAG: hypothetical protein PWP65_1327 [Clostridia bacterium]|nr:hypothetical protein [Clostridia bacterium]